MILSKNLNFYFFTTTMNLYDETIEERLHSVYDSHEIKKLSHRKKSFSKFKKALILCLVQVSFQEYV